MEASSPWDLNLDIVCKVMSCYSNIWDCIRLLNLCKKTKELVSNEILFKGFCEMYYPLLVRGTSGGVTDKHYLRGSYKSIMDLFSRERELFKPFYTNPKFWLDKLQHELASGKASPKQLLYISILHGRYVYVGYLIDMVREEERDDLLLKEATKINDLEVQKQIQKKRKEFNRKLNQIQCNEMWTTPPDLDKFLVEGLSKRIDVLELVLKSKIIQPTKEWLEAAVDVDNCEAVDLLVRSGVSL